jgi:hypothetical protein
MNLPSSNAANEPAGQTGAQPFLQQEQHQRYALAADAISAFLRTAEICSEVQLHALQRCGRTWRQVAERLHAATGPLDMIGVQNQIVMDAMLQFVQLAQDLTLASDAARSAAPVVKEAATVAKEAPTATVPKPTMQTSLMEAWRTMLNPLGQGGAMSFFGPANGAPR